LTINVLAEGYSRNASYLL